MKRYINTTFFLVCTFASFAQAPQKFNYQAVARNNQGVALGNQAITIRASILDGSLIGATVFSEVHSITTTQTGLFTIAIGGGINLIGTFSNVAWNNGDKYLKIEMDPVGTNNFSLVGTSQLLSVPYAIFAEKTNIQGGNGISVVNNIIKNTGDIDPTNELQTLRLKGDTLSISNGNGVILPSAPVYTGGQGIQILDNTITNTGDNDDSQTNEIQKISIKNNVVSLSKGGDTINLPTPKAGTGIDVNGWQITNTGDVSSTNELQMLSLGGNMLSLSNNGGTVTLPTPIAGTGIGINGWQITNTGDASSTNELQTLSLGGNMLSLSNNGGTVTLPTPIAGAGIGVNGWQVTNTGDISNTNELQTLSLTGNTLTLSQNGGTITLPNTATSQWAASGSNIYYNGGNVGIGTASPGEKLHLSGKMKIDGTNTLEFGAGISGKQMDAGKIGYGIFSTNTLDIIGGGTSSAGRKIKFWNEGGADFTGNIGIAGKVVGLTSAAFPIGITQELNGTTPLLHLDMNYRHPNKDNAYLGAAFRIDSRNNSGSSLFQWLYRAANSTTENFLMTLDNAGNTVMSGTVTTTGLKIPTNAAVGKVLTSDASGNATWQATSGGGGQWSTITGGVQYTGGKVLIGNVAAPGNYKLYVEQGILAERVKVALKSTSYWADYVFAPSYKLMPLDEVEAFIQEKRHLPNVPSAAEVAKEGIDVATMDAKLLEKIEELTLYIIEMRKENEALKSRIEKLENGKK